MKKLNDQSAASFDDKLALSIDETAQIMGLGRSKVYDMIGAGALPARKIGRRTVILRDDALAALKAAPVIPVRVA